MSSPEQAFEVRESEPTLIGEILEAMLREAEAVRAQLQFAGALEGEVDGSVTKLQESCSQ